MAKGTSMAITKKAPLKADEEKNSSLNTEVLPHHGLEKADYIV